MPLAQSTLTRGPWLAPPPPSFDPNQSVPALDDALLDTSRASLETGHSRSPAIGSLDGVSATNPPFAHAMIPPPQYTQPEVESRGLSRGMVVALTTAILLPPALLMGAILGYLIALRW
jgi:hypothetical protein